MKFLLTCIAFLLVSPLGGVSATATTSVSAGGLRLRAAGEKTYRRRLCPLLPGCGSSHSSGSGSGAGESGSDGSNGRDAASQGASRATSLLVYFLATATVAMLFAAAYKRRRVRILPSNHADHLDVLTHNSLVHRKPTRKVTQLEASPSYPVWPAKHFRAYETFQEWW
jgi:hypothetical protein